MSPKNEECVLCDCGHDRGTGEGREHADTGECLIEGCGCMIHFVPAPGTSLLDEIEKAKSG